MGGPSPDPSSQFLDFPIVVEPDVHRLGVGKRVHKVVGGDYVPSTLAL